MTKEKKAFRLTQRVAVQIIAPFAHVTFIEMVLLDL
jgi:hypothetical protein